MNTVDALGQPSPPLTEAVPRRQGLAGLRALSPQAKIGAGILAFSLR